MRFRSSVRDAGPRSLGRARCLNGAPRAQGLWTWRGPISVALDFARPRARSPVLARTPARPGLLLTTGADEPIPPWVLSAARPRPLALRTTLPTGEFLPSPRRQSSRVRRRGGLAGRVAGVLVRAFGRLGPLGHLPIHTRVRRYRGSAVDWRIIIGLGDGVI